MDFSPHHRFRGCRRLEREVDRLADRNDVPEEIYNRYRRYHFAVVHKLRSAFYHAETLPSYLATQETSRDAPADLVHRVNFHFDGFTHSTGSAMDIFAREVLTYFGLPLPDDVYFGYARSALNRNRPGDPLLRRLEDPNWRDEFLDYRNAATHERVIGTEYRLEVEVLGGAEKRRLVFPLPDDPRAPRELRTYRRNPDIVEYVQDTFRRAVSCFNIVYNDLRDRLRAEGQLPL